MSLLVLALAADLPRSLVGIYILFRNLDYICLPKLLRTVALSPCERTCYGLNGTSSGNYRAIRLALLRRRSTDQHDYLISARKTGIQHSYLSASLMRVTNILDKLFTSAASRELLT